MISNVRASLLCSSPRNVWNFDPRTIWSGKLLPCDDSGAVEIKALDAAMPFDFEAKAQARMVKAKQLTVGIVGFGTFGQFLAERLVQAGHKVRLER